MENSDGILSVIKPHNSIVARKGTGRKAVVTFYGVLDTSMTGVLNAPVIFVP